MNLQFNSEQILSEIKRMEQINKLSWEEIIKKRLNRNLKFYTKDIEYIVNSLSHYDPFKVIKKL